MDRPRLLLIGLDEPEVDDLRPRLDPDLALVVWPVVPPVRLVDGALSVESASTPGRWLPVSRVVFHGVFEQDLALIRTLALWARPCLPSALGLLDLRERLPGLARARAASRFGALPRGFAPAGRPFEAPRESVAKWGLWHCGEDKARFTGVFTPPDDAVVEPFVPGHSVRIALCGERAWQVRLEGDGWLRSLHDPRARLEEPRSDLLEDARALARRFDLCWAGVDYQLAADETPHLLEVNHAPNLTRFPELRAAFLDEVVRFAAIR